MTRPTVGDFVSFQPNSAQIEQFPLLKYAEKCWIGGGMEEILIALNQINGFYHVKIRRMDNSPIDDFYTFQKIKNLVLGEEAEAVQVYPRESDLVDSSNTYHLWSWDGIEKVLPNLKKLPRYQ